MHLSLLSDASISHEGHLTASRAVVGRAYRDAVLRGVLFLAAISIPLCLAVATGQAHLADASVGYAQSFEAHR